MPPRGRGRGRGGKSPGKGRGKAAAKKPRGRPRKPSPETDSDTPTVEEHASTSSSDIEMLGAGQQVQQQEQQVEAMEQEGQAGQGDQGEQQEDTGASDLSQTSHASQTSPPAGGQSTTTSKAKRQKIQTNFTDDEELMLAEWLEAHPYLFNKKLKDYKNADKKNELWSSMAIKLNRDEKMLRVWYKSLRTRYGRLIKKASGQADTDAELTDRDRWILTNLEFLKPHMYEVNRRTAVSVSVHSIY